MTWSLYRWTWLVESPLYIGMPPAGSLNRCRVYVPARALWGAITAEMARAVAGKGFPAYREVGDQICGGMRFTYLFPAEKDRWQWRAWLPRYEIGSGLVWQREGNGPAKVRDREVRMRLLATRLYTAIDPSSDTAAEGSLRETECVNSTWREDKMSLSGPVGFVGYVFVSSKVGQALGEALEKVESIAVGGDTRYGLGRLRRACMERAGDVFGQAVDLGRDDPEVEADRVLAHSEVGSDSCMEVIGAMEVLRGWSYGETGHWRVDCPLWVPGSAVRAPLRWRIEASGLWAVSMVSVVERK